MAQRPLAPLARHRWQSTLHRWKCTSGRRRLRAPLHHSAIPAPGRRGWGGSSAGRRCSGKAGHPAPCGSRQAGLLAAARGHSSGRPCTPPLLFWGLPTPFPISQGTIPAPGHKAGLPEAPGSRSVLPRCPLLLCWSRWSPRQDRGPGSLPLHATAPPSGMRGARPARAHT